jgi:hypothetical protein
MRKYLTITLLLCSSTAVLAGPFGRQPKNFTPVPAIQIACNEPGAARCQQQAHYCMDNICKFASDPAACRAGCLNTYAACKIGYGCG